MRNPENIYERTFMAVKTVKSGVVAITGVGSIALNTLPTVPAWYGGIETLSSAVSPYTLFLIYFPF